MSEQNLTTILVHLISASEADAAPKIITLPRGLVVLINSAPTKFTLRTWRVNRVPDVQEWLTCFNYLPDGYKPSTKPEPIEVQEHKQIMLSASWTVLKLF
jgi:hypothetical protein